MKEITDSKFTPSSGYVLIIPLEQDGKSDLVVVQDSVDRPHKGTVLAVGARKLDENGLLFIDAPVKVGDFVLYSIAGVERFKMLYKNNPRYEFVVAPFSRILGVIT